LPENKTSICEKASQRQKAFFLMPAADRLGNLSAAYHLFFATPHAPAHRTGNLNSAIGIKQVSRAF